ncbi:NUDIX hydrolase [Paenibacillus sp. MMS18-CY102]|uniref:NUDIX hydrolase n=1 Tax=Paenibacillus sp. MMS18-CY102 TaxID=2682849 RepID=UPI0013658931|nr:NUDIX hydrolase [Paenibacillus sp. MMS18-CY102]MWC29377.1 NUDIX domain-containing protein [Paenibacillus sp. MMS18-CY102]
MFRVDVVYALITNEEQDKVLIVRNIHSSSWSLPGGAVEAEESWSAAVKRETREETGIEVDVLGVCAINECFFEDRGEHVIFATFKAKAKQADLYVSRPHEIAEVQWVSLDEADQRMPYYKCGIKTLIESNSVPYDFQGKQTLQSYNT